MIVPDWYSATSRSRKGTKVKIGASLAVLCSLLSIVSTTAFAVEIRGSSSCGEWVSSRGNDKAISQVRERWLVGFLSGVASAIDKDFLKGTDNSSMYLWVDNYCRSKPLEDMGDAASALVNALLRQKK